MELVTGLGAPRAADIRQTVIDRHVEACSDAIAALVAGLEHNVRSCESSAWRC
jgi:hypothetical protein